MTIEIVFGVVLFLLTVAVLAITMAIRSMDRKIEKVDAVMNQGLANLAKTVSDVVDTTTSLSDKMADYDVDPVSKKIDEAKQEVLSEWIRNITEYDPYTRAPHRGD